MSRTDLRNYGDAFACLFYFSLHPVICQHNNSDLFFIHDLILQPQGMCILPHLVWQSDHWSDLDNRCAWKCTRRRGSSNTNIHYDVTGLLSAVWTVTLRSTCLGCLSWPGRRGVGHTQVNLSGLSELDRVEGGRILIAHICLISRSLPVADNLVDADVHVVPRKIPLPFTCSPQGTIPLPCIPCVARRRITDLCRFSEYLTKFRRYIPEYS